MTEDGKPPVTAGGGRKKKWKGKGKRAARRPAAPTKFHEGIGEMGGNHFDCVGYGQPDRFVRTIAKMADYVGQNYKCGGITRGKVES